MKRLALISLLLAGASFAQVFSREVRECARCHPAQAKLHPGTSMAHAAKTVAECGILRQHNLMTARVGAFTYTIERKGEQSLYTVSDGASTITLPIRYAFGLGEAGQTYILEDKGDFIESFVSYYKALDGLDITIGDQPLHPATLNEGVGRRIGLHEIQACFGCHTTGSIHDGKLDETTLQPGVQCEHCHGPTENHLAGLKKGDAQLFQMKKLTAMNAEDSAQFCGQCHRTWDYVAEHGPHGPGNVRFQPYRLTNSKCFDVDDQRISCLACHNPHKNINRVAADYDAKCQACHAPGAKAGAKPCSQQASQGCSTCHMPKVELPGSHHKFTDHNIRITALDAPFPP